MTKTRKSGTLPTTPRSSDQGVGRAVRLWIMAAGCLVLATQVTGCVAHTQPDELFQLKAESAANRAMQTRGFETRDEAELLSASAAVLQDLGFQVEESVREVGFLR